jgi:hypothetical protein
MTVVHGVKEYLEENIFILKYFTLLLGNDSTNESANTAIQASSC